MIHIIDLNAYGNFHVLFNISMFKVLMEAYPNKKLIIYCQQSHWDCIKKFFSQTELNERISHHSTPIKTNKEITTASLPGIVWREGAFFKNILKKVPENSDDFIFLSSVHSLSFLAFKLIKKIYNKPLVIATMHGEVEFLYQAYTKWEKQTKFIYKLFFQIRAPRFQHLFLNKISKSKLIHDKFVTENNSIEIDHPYLYDTSVPSRKKTVSDTVMIGQIGSMGMRKNAHLFYELANLSKDEIKDNTLAFWTIGPIEDDVIPFKNSLVNDLLSNVGNTEKSTDGYIPRAIYESKLNEIDYAVFFYNDTQFIFRASGAVHDVISYNKPLIVLRHPYFEYLFHSAGNIGFICDTLTAMSDLLKRIASRDHAILGQYEEQCNNLELYKNKNGIQFIASDFNQQIQKNIKENQYGIEHGE